MIEAKAFEGHVTGLNASGDMMEVALDIGSIAQALHNVMKKTNPAAAAEFKLMLQWVVSDESPLWASGGEVLSGKASVMTFQRKRKE